MEAPIKVLREPFKIAPSFLLIRNYRNTSYDMFYRGESKIAQNCNRSVGFVSS